MCCSLFVPASLLSVPSHSSAQTPCHITLCCHPPLPALWLTPPCPVPLPGHGRVVQPAACRGFAPVPWKRAVGTSPGPRGTVGPSIHCFPFLLQRGAVRRGQANASVPTQPCAKPVSLCPRGQRFGLWALLGHSSCSQHWILLRERQQQEQDAPKQVRLEGRGRQVPLGPLCTKENLFIPSGAAPSGEASAQPRPGAFLPGWALQGRGGSDTWGVPGMCPCSTLHGAG